MDLDRLTRWRVTATTGRQRTFRKEADARAHARTQPGAKVATFVVWQVRYRDPDGRQRSKDHARKPDATKFMATTEADKLRGSWIDPRAGRRTLRSFGEEWRQIQIHQPGTTAKLEGDLRRHVYPVLGDLELAKVRRSHLQAWARGLTGKLAPSTIEVIATYLATILSAAAADGIIARSPYTDISLPAVEPPKIVPWPVENVDLLTDAMPARYRALVTYAAGTGARQGEIFGLTVGQLRMLEREVDVDWQAQPAAGGGIILCRPKTKASRRTIPLAKTVLDALAAHLAAHPAAAQPIIHRERDGSTFVADEQLVFTNTFKRPLRRSGFNEHVWAAAVTKATLPAGAHMHELRHFYASLLIHKGASVKVVQERLGHASADETLRTYAHLWPDEDDRTRAAIDEVLNREGRLSKTAGRPGPALDVSP